MRLIARIASQASFLKFALPVAAGLGLATPGFAAHRLLSQSSGHLVKALTDAAPASALAPDRTMTLSLALPVRDKAELDAFVKDVYDPLSPNFRRFLKPGEFAGRFGPTEADYQKLVQFAQSHGFSVTQTFSNRMVVDVAGPVSAVQTTFHVNELVYRRANGSQFFAPDREPTVDDAVQVPLLAVGGLDNADPPHQKYAFKPFKLKAATGIGGYSPSDFKTAYSFPTSLNGSGITLGVFQNTGYLASDITTFEDHYGLAQVPLTNVYLDGKNSGNQGQSGETTLDIEMQVAMAPGATKEVVYIGGSGLDIATKIASDDVANVVSSSIGYNDGTQAAENLQYEQMAAQGQSYFVASGDSGGWTSTASGSDNPADQPYVTSVGGTHLNTNSNGSYASEQAWVGSGGGSSVNWGLPSYQSNISMSSNGGSTSARNCPDVSFCADTSPGISFYNNGAWGSGTGGTSFAAPLWAGITALVDQQRAINGLKPIGFINPAIYSLGKSTRYSSDFHDITSGSTGRYSAVTGYDLATGWGTPIVSNLVTDLSKAYEPGTYSIISVQSGLALDGAANTQGTKTQLYGSNNTFDQKWTISAYGTGFTIVSVQTGLALDAGAATQGTNTQMWSLNNSNVQVWSIAPSGGGYSIICQKTGLALDGGPNVQGTNPWLYGANGTVDQQWKFVQH
ncbi:pseudomonapepsin [Capsulimonas corticalis]|uniref:Pseudomonapepsin n=1 Tax=Capsulimonas corticalis TaxID=2219043 RepID=A0A402D5F9_9BACT|nr:protease pro-enzyme activation domain-containing protein [Capsulimonas corticalis]BDI29865.1 pseudomonapepsin [Capsulimonas corticalis]